MNFNKLKNINNLNVFQVMTTVAAKNIDISLGNANEVILKLAVSGHSEKVEEVCPKNHW